MASDSDTVKTHCLVCAAVIPTQQSKVEKLEALFLLQILLEIPPENQLIGNLKSSMNLLQLCNRCLSTVTQCKQIYSEISEKIEKFWEIQNKLLDNFNSIQEFPQIAEDDSANWATQCRKFVKQHDFSGFGYPFIIHDLETLLTSNQPPPLPQKLPPGITCTIASESSSSQLSNDNNSSENLKTNKLLPPVTCTVTGKSPSDENPLDSITSMIKNIPVKKSKPTYPSPQNVTITLVQDNSCNSVEEYDANFTNSSECSSDDEQEYSEKPKIIRIIIAPNSSTNKSPGELNLEPNGQYLVDKMHQMDYNFDQDPTTRRFLCLDPSCSKSSTSKQYITNHYEVDHLKVKEKESFPCEWPGCGKSMGDKQTLREHMDKHNGTPSYECKLCGEKFYYRKRLVIHRRDVHGEIVLKRRKDQSEINLTTNAKEQEVVSQQRKRRLNQEVCVNQEVYKCDVRECKGRRFKDGMRLQAHMDQHSGTPREICGKCGHRFYYRFHLEEHQKQFGHL